MASDNKKKVQLSRKDFLKASAGMIGIGLFGSKVFASDEKKFSKIKLGKTGIKVSPICYGASRSQEASLVRASFENGINFFDTGRQYSNGNNEIMLGKEIKSIRDKVVIQSKMKIYVNPKKEDIKSLATSKKIKNIMENNLTESLKALQTDYIDIMLWHLASYPELLFHDTILEFFYQAKKSGKIKSFGFSSHNNNLEVVEAAAKNPVYEIVMVPYNHKGSYIHSLSNSFNEWDQPRLEKSLKSLHASGVGIIAMKTCSGGTYSFNESEKPSYSNSIKWVLNKNYIDCAAVAMGNFAQIGENIKAMD